MIPLLRVGHAAAGQKRPAQERRPTALFFKQRKVQVQRKMRPAIVAERAPDRVELVLLRDAEDELAAVLRLVREFVKAQGKCLLEELWETRGEFVIFRDDAHLVCGECAGVQQHAAALGHGAAAPVDRNLAELRFYVIGERHAATFFRFKNLLQPRVMSR